MKFCANSSSQFLPLANRQIKVGPCHFEVLHSRSLYARMMPKVCNAWQWQVAAVSTAINSFGFIAIFLWNDFWCNVAVQGMLKKCHFSSFLAYFCRTKFFTSKLRIFFYKNCKHAFYFSLIFREESSRSKHQFISRNFATGDKNCSHIYWWNFFHLLDVLQDVPRKLLRIAIVLLVVKNLPTMTIFRSN